jgi:Cu-Zn family superoxide dismutase
MNSTSQSALLAVWLTVVPAALAAQAADGPAPVRATFAVIDTGGKRIGQVTVVQQPTGVLLQMLLTGLTPGRHGMHIHAAPACDPPAFTTAGGHLNPDGKQHGHHNPAGAHLGDLPNLEVNAKGEGRAQLDIEGVTFTAGPHSIGVPGTALIIHAAEDDDQSDPAGKAGPRIACAVLSVTPG